MKHRILPTARIILAGAVPEGHASVKNLVVPFYE